MDILKDLAKNRGKCVIIVTHSEFAQQYADEVVYIAGGKIVETA